MQNMDKVLIYRILILLPIAGSIFFGVIYLIRVEQVFTMENLLQAYHMCRSSKQTTEEVIRYHNNYLVNLYELQNRIFRGAYKCDKLYTFIVYEPKKRIVTANRFEDKIVQRLLCDKILCPMLLNRMIYDNYASQPNKGIHVALKRLQKFMYRHMKDNHWVNKGYVLSCDIKKFFYSIDKDICYQQLQTLDIDNILMNLLYETIFNVVPRKGNQYNVYGTDYIDDPSKGLCIGFQTSQWLAVYYLNGLDHFIKEKLHIKYYGRYMDDFYLIHNDRAYLEYCLQEIQKYLTEKLHLTLNKKTQIFPISQGVCFLGYRCCFNPHTHEVDILIRSKSVRRMIRRFNRQIKLAKHGKISIKTMHQSLESWKSYMIHGKTNRAMNAYYRALQQIREIDPDWNPDYTTKSSKSNKSIQKYYAKRDLYHSVLKMENPDIDTIISSGFTVLVDRCGQLDE